MTELKTGTYFIGSVLYYLTKFAVIKVQMASLWDEIYEFGIVTLK